MDEFILKNAQAIIYKAKFSAGKPNLCIQEINHHVHKLLGYMPEEFISDPTLWFSIIHPDDVTEIQESYTELKEKGEPVTWRYRAKHKNSGLYLYLEDTLTSITDSTGAITGYVGVVHDCTEQQQRIKQLIENERWYNLLVNNIKDYEIITLDPNGIILNWNNGSAQLKGYKSEEIIGKHFSKFYPEEDVKCGKPERELSIAAADGRVEDEGWRVRKNGSLFWADVIITRICDDDGKIIGFAKISRDNTESKRVKNELEESESKLKAFLESIPDGLVIVDKQGKIILTNTRTEKLFGYSQTELLGQSINILLPEQLRQIHKHHMTEFFTNPKNRPMGANNELYGVRKDGSKFFVEISLNHVKTRDEVLAISVIRDVTEKKNFEKQQLRSQRMESIGTLAGGIAHDLNNILSPIMMSIEILRRMYEDERGKSILDLLSSSAQRGADLIKQVLSFARGVEGKRIVIQIQHVIKDIEKIAKETFPKSITFSSNINKNLWTINADPSQLHQVFMNICINAIDAMPNGGNLSISADNIELDEKYSSMNVDAKKGKYIIIVVSDTGTGMSPEVSERIFEPFFTTKEVGKGTGLGLSTTRTIIKNHDGFINVYSELGKGSVFKIYLPAVEGEQPIAQEEGETLPAGKGELILVVDDETAIREITKSTLEAYGYKVMIAEDGTAAVALYAQHVKDIALVITDMMMPHLDGLSTIRVVRQLSPNAKIIATSGMLQHIPADPILRGITFLQKPYPAKKLITTIYNVLHG